ncbi:MAG: hypothetical protein IT317_05455 [Anaerolineales bacterium]|nr:hypothetical protein [Anaerolineales bacterium]
MKPAAAPVYPWIYSFTLGSLFGATALRSLIQYQANPARGPVLVILSAWLVLFLGEALLAPRWPGFFPGYLMLQSLLALALLFRADAEDYPAALFGLLSMQLMQRYRPRMAALGLAAFAVLMALPLVTRYGAFTGVAFTLIYTFGSSLLATYALATRRAVEAHTSNQALLQQLRQAHQQLQLQARQSQQLAATRERRRLARELHDSVTQTLFAMGLTTQSARLLLERDAGRAAGQLDQLSRLARSALSELQALISELHPDQGLEGGLATTVRRHLAGRYWPEGLAVSLAVEGQAQLAPAEVHGLFGIIQEALNNVVKHAPASQAHIHLHLAEPPWVEIVDQGPGFETLGAAGEGRLGLTNMRERAAEIGWKLRITSAPGAGTRVRVEKSTGEGQEP